VADRRIDVLDHGYLSLVDAWGSDERIVEAARMSTGKGFLGWGPKCQACGDSFDAPERSCPTPAAGREFVDAGRGGHLFIEPGDEKLLRFLWDNAHATPFEMAGLTVEVQAPIFVFREWHRHRVPFGYNEMSSRYAPLPDVNYIPSVERLMIGADGKNKQAGTTKGAEALTLAGAERFREVLATVYAQQQSTYEWALGAGVPKELARVHLPVGRYSRMRATGNLRGWLGFLKLRLAPNAQYEIREYARALAAIVAEAFPWTWAVARASVGAEEVGT